MLRLEWKAPGECGATCEFRISNMHRSASAWPLTTEGLGQEMYTDYGFQKSLQSFLSGLEVKPSSSCPKDVKVTVQVCIFEPNPEDATMPKGP